MRLVATPISLFYFCSVLFALSSSSLAQSGVGGGVGAPGGFSGGFQSPGDRYQFDGLTSPEQGYDFPGDLYGPRYDFIEGITNGKKINPDFLYSPDPLGTRTGDAIDQNQLWTIPETADLSSVDTFKPKEVINATNVLEVEDINEFYDQRQNFVVNFEGMDLNDAILAFEEQGLNYPQTLDLIPDETFNRSILNQYLSGIDASEVPEFDQETYKQQVSPGTGIDGVGGFESCGSCGPDLMVAPGTGIDGGSSGNVGGGEPLNTDDLEVITDDSNHTGPKCPEEFCGEDTNIAGCKDDLCRYPIYQNLLDNNEDGRADLVYRKNGYPEAVFMMRRVSGVTNPTPNCTATALAKRWLITALHCLGSTKNALEKNYTVRTPVREGWTKIGISDASILLGIDVIVTVKGHGKAHFEAAHINYDSLESVEFSAKGTPTRDFAIIELAGDGLDLGEYAYPFVRTDYIKEREAISFSGFGWTNILLQKDPNFENLPIDEKWAELKLAAFNFIQSYSSDPLHENTMLKWENGNPNGTGGPCRYDSGGPVYAGFNRGFWNDPRQVIGVVSGLRGAKVVDDGNDCLGNRTHAVAEHISHYYEGLCKITGSAPRGCSE